MKITLTDAQLKVLIAHAAKKRRTPEDDIVQTWWGRMQALATYAAKKFTPTSAKRPAKAPKAKPVDVRHVARVVHIDVKKLPKDFEGKASGINKVKQIDPYDIPSVALAKARITEEKLGTPVSATLKAAGRNSKGEKS